VLTVHLARHIAGAKCLRAVHIEQILTATQADTEKDSELGSRGGPAVRVPSMLATKPPTRVRSSAYFSQVAHKRSESRDGYSSAIKMPAVKSS